MVVHIQFGEDTFHRDASNIKFAMALVSYWLHDEALSQFTTTCMYILQCWLIKYAIHVVLHS